MAESKKLYDVLNELLNSPTIDKMDQIKGVTTEEKEAVKEYLTMITSNLSVFLEVVEKNLKTKQDWEQALSPMFETEKEE